MEKKRIGFRYHKEGTYIPKYVNGAIGGVTPTKEIVFDFYLERNRIPELQLYELGSEGALGDVTVEEPDYKVPHLDRIIQCGIVMNLETAKKIHEFLATHIKKLDKKK